MLSSFRQAVADARRTKQLYFAALISEDYITKSLGDATRLWHSWIYTPTVTVWMFLTQCLSEDHSCRDTVTQLIAARASQGLSPCSPETGGYCIARDRLPEDACHRMVCETGRDLENEMPDEWKWHGRKVRAVDGATITMPDTPENQKAYPQIPGQALGCGFPIARILVVFSLSVGTVLDAAIGRYQGKKTGENSMFRSLHNNALRKNDIVLADRYFSGWFDIAMLKKMGVDMLVSKHQLLKTDFRRVKQLGENDYLFRIAKPQRPDWMALSDYTLLPDDMLLREVHVRVERKVFRTKSLVVVTTLLDDQEYSAEEIAGLYRQRWQAELYLRSIKCVLQMDHLRCKKPQRVRNEFWMHLLGYNLIRRVMALAAVRSGQLPFQVSFKGTLQTLDRFLPMLGLCDESKLTQWCDTMLGTIASHVVGNRPDRYEPRRVKRRRKPYKYLTEPRQNYRNRLAEGS